jgi:hypothetical protein
MKIVISLLILPLVLAGCTSGSPRCAEGQIQLKGFCFKPNTEAFKEADAVVVWQISAYDT